MITNSKNPFPPVFKKTHGRIIKFNLHNPSVEEELRVEYSGLSLDTEFLSVPLFSITLSIILLIKGQCFLKMDRWWMETIGDLLIHRIREYNFSFWFPFVR